MKTNKSTKISRPKFRPPLAIVIILALVVGGVVYGVSWKSSHKNDATATPQPMGPAADTTTPTPSQEGNGPATDTSTAGTPSPVANPSHPTTGTLAKPTGDPLNKDTISLTAAPSNLQYNTRMSSNCQTVIGGYCGLQLTGPGGQIKQVPPSATQNGANAFDWDAGPAGLGLAAGTWKVQLYASYNGQTNLGDINTLMVNP